MIKKISFIFGTVILIAALTALTACQTVPTSVPEGISEAELLQLGQTAFDNSKYKAAEFYYTKVIELYGSDISSLVAAEYELAHLKIKRKDFSAAKPELQRILAYYDDPQTALALPPAYKKLVLTDLAKCDPKPAKSKTKKKRR